MFTILPLGFGKLLIAQSNIIEATSLEEEQSQIQNQVGLRNTQCQEVSTTETPPQSASQI